MEPPSQSLTHNGNSESIDFFKEKPYDERKFYFLNFGFWHGRLYFSKIQSPTYCMRHTPGGPLAASAANAAKTATKPATKNPEKIPEIFLKNISNNDLTRQIEVELVQALRTKRTSGVKQISQRLHKEDQWSVEKFFTHYVQLPLDESAELAFKLGACEAAALVIRRIVDEVATNKVNAKEKAGVYLLVNSDLDNRYFEHRRRCELLKRLPPTDRLIGTSCLVDGKNCTKN